MMAPTLRNNWTREEIAHLYHRPLIELVFDAQRTHRQHFKAGEVQKSALLSIKTGACPEDCDYCPQSARYQTEVKAHGLMGHEAVMTKAQQAKRNGATRFCMGAAWREIPEGPEFDQILKMVQEVASLNMEVCCTLGMLTDSQAKRLATAGLTAYNHNLDTSPEYYGKIITTRTYRDRLATLSRVRKAGLQVCCGGIIGMGEKVEDRIGLLHALATQRPHPESVPINLLVKIQGTPLAQQKLMEPIELIRTIATARMTMPKSLVRLSAGRTELSDEAQALAFLAGANSIFLGDQLLTTTNPSVSEDNALFQKLGLKEMPLPTAS